MRVGKLVVSQWRRNLGGHRHPFPPSPRGLLVKVPCGKKSLRRLLAVAEKLKAIPHLDEAEKLLYARGLISTPDER